MERMELLLGAALAALAIGILLSLVRVVRGPRLADRILGINMIGTLVSLSLAALAVGLGEAWLLDVCILYAMLSFLAVLVLAKVGLSGKEAAKDA